MNLFKKTRTIRFHLAQLLFHRTQHIVAHTVLRMLHLMTNSAGLGVTRIELQHGAMAPVSFSQDLAGRGHTQLLASLGHFIIDLLLVRLRRAVRQVLFDLLQPVVAFGVDSWCITATAIGASVAAIGTCA